MKILELLKHYERIDMWPDKDDPGWIHFVFYKRMNGNLLYVKRKFHEDTLWLIPEQGLLEHIDANFEHIVK